MGAFEDFVIAELPLRQVLFSFTGDPSTGDGKAASPGTYIWDENNIRWEKVGTGATDWQKVGSVHGQSVYATVTANSAAWYSTASTFSATSASWDSVYTKVNAQSGLYWDGTYTTVKAQSGLYWDGTYSTVKAQSGLYWSGTYSTVKAQSGLYWSGTYSTVKAQSGLYWSGTYSTVKTNSAVWSAPSDRLVPDTITASHNLTAGMAVRLNEDGTYETAVARSIPFNLKTDVLSAEVLGIVQSSNATYGGGKWSGTEFDIVYGGVCNIPNHNIGAQGTTVFLAASSRSSNILVDYVPGTPNLTSAAPCFDYDISKPVGTVLDSNNILVQTYRGQKIFPMPNDEDDWSSAYETMNSLSGLWGGGELGNRAFATLSGLSAGWQSTANTFSGASGGWDSAYTTAKSNSATLFTVSGNWNTAYSDRHKWDGGATDLVVATGRTSLGLGTIATQDADSVDIDGGTVDATTIGTGTPAAGEFTTLKITSPAAVPATADATGTKGDIRYDNNYVYICVATNTWKRAALVTWT